MEWWYCAPLILAIIMFLLVGTVCERRIEAVIRRIIERRRAMMALTPPPPEYEDITCSTSDLPQISSPPAMITPSQKSSGDCIKGETVLSEDQILEVQIQNRKLLVDVAC